MKTIWLALSIAILLVTVLAAIIIGFGLANAVGNSGKSSGYLIAAVVFLLATTGMVYMTFKMSK